LDRQKFSAIGHGDHDYCNPLSAGKIERVLDLLPLNAKSQALDLGCGRGELSLRLIERFKSRVVAVDRSAAMLDAARERARRRGVLDRLELIDADIATHAPPADAFDLTAMLGGGGIADGIAGICARLKSWTRPGGHVLIAEGFWARAPSPEYLAVLGGTEDEFRDHRGNVQAGIDAGLIPMYATVSSTEEWDDYEWKYDRSIERYAREQPNDPDVPAMLERIRRWRDGYLRWGRDTLGFAAYLFYRPHADQAWA